MGITESEALAQVAALSSAGIDFIDISGGTYEDPQMAQSREKPLRESTRLREAYFTEFAVKARKAAPETIVMVTGGFRTRTGMAAAVQGGGCDLVGMSRPTALEPALPKEKILNREVLDKEAVVVETVITSGGLIKCIPIIGLGTESVSILISRDAMMGLVNEKLDVARRANQEDCYREEAKSNDEDLLRGIEARS